MRARSIVLLVSLALIAVGCRAEEEPELSPSPVATERPEVQLEGTVRTVLSPTEATVDADDDEPDPTGEMPAATDEAGGGIVVQLSALSESLEECGLDAGDTVAVFWRGDTVIEPDDVSSDSRFPENLAGQRVLAAGQIEEVAGQCTLVANRLEVGTDASPSPGTSPSPTASPSRTATARPTATATPRPTATAAPTATPDESP